MCGVLINDGWESLILDVHVMVEPLVVSKFPSDRRARSQLKKNVFPGGFQTAYIRPNSMRLLPELSRPTSLSNTASVTESLIEWMKSEQTPLCNHKSFIARTPGLKSPTKEPYTTWATGGFNSDSFTDEDDDEDPDPFRNVAVSSKNARYRIFCNDISHFTRAHIFERTCFDRVGKLLTKKFPKALCTSIPESCD